MASKYRVKQGRGQIWSVVTGSDKGEVKYGQCKIMSTSCVNM